MSIFLRTLAITAICLRDFSPLWAFRFCPGAAHCHLSPWVIMGIPLMEMHTHINTPSCAATGAPTLSGAHTPARKQPKEMSCCQICLWTVGMCFLKINPFSSLSELCRHLEIFTCLISSLIFLCSKTWDNALVISYVFDYFWYSSFSHRNVTKLIGLSRLSLGVSPCMVVCLCFPVVNLRPAQGEPFLLSNDCWSCVPAFSLWDQMGSQNSNGQFCAAERDAIFCS